VAIRLRPGPFKNWSEPVLADAETKLRSGDLSGALADLQAAVRSDPADAKLRIFLFQMLCVLGDWDRAITQLKLCAELDASALPMAQTYREAIICEVYRDKVFSGEKSPLVFGDPQEWAALLIQALGHLARGETEEAARLRDMAFDQAPAVAGTIDDAPFAWIADADTRLGPMFEAIVNGQYYWVPFSAVTRITLEPPSDLRDVVWMPAHLWFPNGGDSVALIPTRYAGTTTQGDEAQKLARATVWAEPGGDAYTGLGQRLWATDVEDYGLMAVRDVVLDVATEAAVDG
jgi:type VI secretion system protein ImpE